MNDAPPNAGQAPAAQKLKHAPALRFAAFGGPEVLACQDVAVASPGTAEALVRVHAASVNPSDVKNVAGRMRQTVPPRTPGRDFAGVVVEGPAEWCGAEVWGTGGDIGFTRDGSHARFLHLPVAALARKPANLSFAQAGAVGVNYVTAWIGLDYAQLQPGETLLVLGATGGVGGAACGIGAARGCSVIAAVRGEAPADSPARHATQSFIDVNRDDVAAQIAAATGGRGVDVVYDCVGKPALTEAALAALAFGGRMIVIAGTPGEQVKFELIPFYRRECRLLGVDSLKRSAAACAPMMEALRTGFESGAYPPPAIVESYPLARGAEAYAAVARGTRGRVVLTMGD
ncbi:zinc-binding alcohol dehydrogenase family protein [Roseomonas frigidaquae]|uniref:Zinc-binding alcohol dehydrogenase family protein n=1 Tax=Falsiroseomonas frigidaquae TaxID=487318 RepID=A0ABX1EX46_9PROT|nr:zinc-binding alcohol dehydrogenase family protein [Falsiroseomonas frigidaquae]NKE44666.1 zinc-binding alcohol dehydrogenase family protein [Falsiroseomonas frigidaquae]